MIRLLFLTLALLLSASALAQDAKTILETSEQRRRGVQSSRAQMTMTIVRPTWQREMSLKSWSKGDDYALILVTAPANEKGTTTLKRGDEVWNWLPRVERTIKLPRSMMSQSWMGSDLSNDDLVNEISLVEDFDHRILQDTTLQGRTCWKIELIPHENVAVVYSKVIMYVDQRDYLQLRTEEYDEEDYLINVMTASEIQTMDGRPFATRIELIPMEEEGHKTILTYQEIAFNVDLSEQFFSVQNMKRIR
jgi:outer membrane lipoprotein-sorting protein